MMTAALEGLFDDLLGVDVSAASIAQTRAIIGYFAPTAAAKIELRQGDFLQAEWLAPASFDVIVMGEVLEHVESPEACLRKIANLARPDAFIYVTTCINSPAIDHIFLWRTTDELETMIRGCGLGIRYACRLPYEGYSLEESLAKSLAVNVAYVLERM